MLSSSGSRSGSAARLDLDQGLALELLVFLDGDVSGVSKLPELLDLVRRRVTGDPPLDLLLLLDDLPVLLRHLWSRDDVDQRAEERKDEQQNDPAGLRSTAEIIAAKDVAEQRDEQPDGRDPREEHDHGPQHAAERPLSCEHALSSSAAALDPTGWRESAPFERRVAPGAASVRRAPVDAASG